MYILLYIHDKVYFHDKLNFKASHEVFEICEYHSYVRFYHTYGLNSMFTEIVCFLFHIGYNIRNNASY